MSRTKSKVTVPAFMGVGAPTDCGYIPVTYLDGGRPVTFYVGGLHASDVSSNDDDYENVGEIDQTLALHAIATLEAIVECWNTYRDNAIQDHLRQKSKTAAKEAA